MFQSLKGLAVFDMSKMPDTTPFVYPPGCCLPAMAPPAEPRTDDPSPARISLTFFGLKRQKPTLLQAPPPSRKMVSELTMPRCTKKPAPDPSRHWVPSIGYQSQ